MTNPAQWASFENWSVKYAGFAKHRIALLEVPIILIQRWWRQRHLSRKHQHLFPIVVQQKAVDLRWCIDLLLNSKGSFLQQHVFAYEKLDGTNVGVRCDGAVFGRRQQIHESSYQKVPLEGVIPTTSQIQKVKALVSQAAMMDEDPSLMSNVRLVVYGELMVNPSRFGYQEREFAKKWFAFGLVLQEKKQDLAVSKAITYRVSSAGFFATMAPWSGKITVRLNPKLAKILNEAGLQTAPLITNGPLFDVCLAQQEKMMQNDALEGVVLTGQDFLAKWKTGKEDESQGYQMLKSQTEDYSTTVLQAAGVEVDLLFCLKKVAGNRSKSSAVRLSEKMKKPGDKKNKLDVGGPYDVMDLERALQSAMTKYDSLETYFAQDKMGLIIKFLIEELKQDLEASASDEMKCIERYVKKYVGRAFGAWKKLKS